MKILAKENSLSIILKDKIINISKTISSGAAWNLLGLLLNRTSTVIFTLFLARLIAPEDFGKIAMMAVFFELAYHAVNSGLQQAIIRSPKISQTDLSTAFIANIGCSALIYVALFLLAPIVATFYDQIELTNLLRVAGLGVLVNSLSLVPEALYQRRMQFRTLMKLSLIATLSSGLIAVLMAYKDFGVWSLVAQMLSLRIISTILIWQQISWRPILTFKFSSFTKLFGFGYKLLIEGVLEILYQNTYILVIAKLLSAEVLGLYYLADKINSLIAPQISNAIQKASLPALATIQDQKELLCNEYRKIITISMLLISPIIVGIVVLAPYGFPIFFSEEWEKSAIFLQLLCIAGLLYPLHLMNFNILVVKGRSDLVLWVGLVKKIVGIIILIISIPFGIYGILIGQIIASLLALIPNIYFSYLLIGYGYREQLTDLSRSVAAAVLSGISIVLLSRTLPLSASLMFLSMSLAGFSIYLGIAYLLNRKELMLLIQLISKKGNDRSTS